MKIACILTTHLPMKAELQRRPEILDQPVIIVKELGPKRFVLDYSPQSRGVAQGMPVQEAVSLCKDATLLEADEPSYQTSFEDMLQGLDRRVLTSQDILELTDGAPVSVDGLVVRRQRPLGKAVHITLEDECGHTPLVVWPQAYERLRLVLRESLLVVRGVVNRQEGTTNIVVQQARRLKGVQKPPRAKSWN